MAAARGANDKMRRRVIFPIVTQLIEIFSAQMVFFDAVCADYFCVFCGKVFA
jgi:hypothetical protein